MRLDVYLVKNGMCKSRDRAKSLVMSGDCLVNEKIIKKPAFVVNENDVVTLNKEDFVYVGRGGLKLEKALDVFGIDVNGKIALDVGAATGGFTDCLLRRGVKKVYALDIGKGQLEDSLREDSRVAFMPGIDVRDVKKRDFDDDIDIIVVDVSFISVLKILDALRNVVVDGTKFVFLIKPQFETGKSHSGVLKDPMFIDKVLKGVRKGFKAAGFSIISEVESPVLGKNGNREFLWYISAL